MKKYELTDETVRVGSRTLYRVRALCDIFGWGVQKGDTGGFVEAERNLGQFGEAWVSGNAWVSGDAQVFDNARVFGDARVSGAARVFDNARVFGDARVSGAARVFDNARVFGDAQVSGVAQVSGDARVFGDAQVSGVAQVSGDARVFGTEILHVTGLPSGIVTMFPTTDGWTLTIGCWSGTVDELEAMIAGDDWPESEGDEQALRRPGLEALVALCRAHIGLVEARKEQEK